MKNKNIICPRCKECELENHDTGIMEIYFWKEHTCTSLEDLKKNLGKKEQAMRKFEFHYLECPQCDYEKIYEYREIPYYNENIDYSKKPFIEGNVVEHWKYGANKDIYIRHKVIQK